MADVLAGRLGLPSRVFLGLVLGPVGLGGVLPP